MYLIEKLKKYFPTLQKKWYLAAFLFLISLTVYLITLTPTVTTEDSGELISAAYTLGIPHPPGYPLWSILGKLFTFLPISNIAWRINFMSAFFGALTIALLFILVLEFIKNKFIAFSTSLIFAFTDIFWSQSIRAEVYTLNSFFVVLTIFLIIRWSKTKNDLFLYFFAFFYGLSLTNHQEIILFAPAFIIFILLVEKSFWKRYKTILMMLALFLIGLSVYLYLPLRAQANPPINWGNPVNFHNFLLLIKRSFYNEKIIPAITHGNKILFIGNFFNQLTVQFSLFTIVGLFGIIAIFIKEKKFFLLLILNFLITILGAIFFRKLNWIPINLFLLRILYIPIFLIFSIFIALGLEYLWEKFNLLLKYFSFLHKSLRIVLIIIISLLPFYFFLLNFQNNNKSQDYLAYDFVSNMLNSLSSNSVLIATEEGANSDTVQFVLTYLKIVEKKRSDVLFVTTIPMFKQQNTYIKINESDIKEKENNLNELRMMVISQNLASRQVYTTYSLENDTEIKLISKSNGAASRIFSSWEDWKKENIPRQIYYLRNLINDRSISTDPFTLALVARYYYATALAWLDWGHNDRAKEIVLKALEYDMDVQSFAYQGFVFHRANYMKEFKLE